MIKVNNMKTETFKTDFDGFYVDIVEADSEWDVYLWHEDYGTKSFIFGLPKEDTTHDQAIDIVIGNLEEQIELYRQEYMDEDGKDCFLDIELTPQDFETVSYRINDSDFYLDVQNNGEYLQAYLYNSNYAYKRLVIGQYLPAEFDDFMEKYVRDNLPQAIANMMEEIENATCGNCNGCRE